ncbi:helix-hairpin-helix domain-containing protein [Bacillus sp. EB106-08-02-XG196]|uniref:helix-hairpin-helix domain-containing protein n=1 Tax=Bacillus sp. EB106-08-02-XG196 TaxID=2737049 RepID=UPI0015C46009|nr:helix-hairpin-helix domain-containing protein [Bacillus sp. EB106-08-02-XG196]NWQ40097.1 helix-hairpin-helix domain-containing protein [Bacillus sp. EB106-08-02-XG196]
MKDWMYEHKMYVIITAIIAFAAIFYFLEESKSSVSNVENIVQQEIKDEKDNPPVQEEIQEPEIIMVDVKGQVAMPGVYSSNQGERVIDVIQRAGGLTENADESQVNFAEHVQDAMVIYIPAKGEEGVTISTGTSVNPSITGGGSGNQAKINLNKADETQLQNLPGIGPSKAAAITEYRETSGPFKSVEDLKNISGIGDKTFEKLKDLITVQ